MGWKYIYLVYISYIDYTSTSTSTAAAAAIRPVVDSASAVRTPTKTTVWAIVYVRRSFSTLSHSCLLHPLAVRTSCHTYGFCLPTPSSAVGGAFVESQTGVSPPRRSLRCNPSSNTLATMVTWLWRLHAVCVGHTHHSPNAAVV